MADTVASLADQRVSEVLAETWSYLLGDGGIGGAFHTLPVIAAGYAGTVTGKPSLSIKIPRVAWNGQQRLVARTEDNAGTPAAHTDGASTVVCAPQFFAYSQTQEAGATDLLGLLKNPSALVTEAVMKYDARLFEMVAALASGFTTNTVNSTGVALSIDDLFAAIALLDADFVNMGAMLLTNPKGWSTILNDLRTESGTVLANDPATLAKIATLGARYKGSIGGVDIFTSSFMPAVSADTYSVVLTPGSVNWADGLPYSNGSRPSVDVAGKVLLEMDREPLSGRNNTIFHALLGVVEGQDAAGARIQHLT